jgi:hypothetical protein
MALNDIQRDAMNKIDQLLRADNAEFTNVAVDLEAYYEWYSRLLGALALLAEDDEIVFGATTYDATAATGSLVLFTSRLVIHVQLRDVAGDEATVETRAVARSSLRTLGLAITDRVETDQWGRSNHRWPGRVTLTLEYPAISGAVVLAARGFDPYDRDEVPASLRLVNSLRADLGAAS